jgi:hypothetical protein
VSILDASADVMQAAAPVYIPPPPPKASAWAKAGAFATAIPRGITQAVGEVGASAVEFAAAPFKDTEDNPAQRVADSIRWAAQSYRPDAQTATTAETLLHGFARGATKIIGGALTAGPAGVIAAGLEEANTQAEALQMQGVDSSTARQAGFVQGAGLALAALPIAGQTIKGTLGLYAAGGPGGYVAQQAATREILQSAGYMEQGAQFDPTDPLGLAVATLLPAPFAAAGFRSMRNAAAVQSLPDLPARAVPDAPAAVAPDAPPSALTPIAQAIRYPQEALDAAMVRNLNDAAVAQEAGTRAALITPEDAAAFLRLPEVALERVKPTPAPDADQAKAALDATPVDVVEGRAVTYAEAMEQAKRFADEGDDVTLGKMDGELLDVLAECSIATGSA